LKQKAKKDINKVIKETNQAFSEYLTESRLKNPQWYWHLGLHDAWILKINEIEFDYSVSSPKRNCLEIFLDSRGATFDTKVNVIRFYNYKLHVKIRGNRWVDDTLKKDGGKYVLQLTTAKAREEIVSTITFDFAEVERKQ